MEKEIAIIIPAYNAHDTIENLLDSINQQTILNKCAIILIDDCSEKKYDYLIEKYPTMELIIFRLEKNSGPGIARNEGIKYAINQEIPYIVFSDSDDELYGKYGLQCLLSTIKRTSGDLIHSPILVEGEEQKEIYAFCDGAEGFLFGKIYKTSIIKKYGINFFHLHNEDGCFNLKYYAACQNIIEFDYPIYLWKFNKNSIGRKNNGEHCKKTFYADCDNLLLAYKEMFKNNVYNKNNLLITIPGNLSRLYVNCQYYQNLLEKQEYVRRIEKIKQIYLSLKELFPEIILKQLWYDTAKFISEWEECYNFYLMESNNNE